MSNQKYIDFNQKQYDGNLSKYIENNHDGYVGGLTPDKRVEYISTVLPVGRRIFEIGSGPGYDALALKQFGYDVKPSDYVDAFVQFLREKGFDAIKFNAKKDSLDESYDAIYANAVFVHFDAKEIGEFLSRVKDSLKNEKIVFISFIKGEGHERSGRVSGVKRDFNYHTLDELTNIANLAGYKIVSTNDVDQKWFQIILKA